MAKAVTTIYTITGQAFDRKTGKAVEEKRDDNIDIANNKIFTNCTTILEIKQKYESFWNDLNPESEIVFVSKVVKKEPEIDKQIEQYIEELNNIQANFAEDVEKNVLSDDGYTDYQNQIALTARMIRSLKTIKELDY